MRIKGLPLFVLAGVCSAGPAAATSRFVVLSAPRSFSIPHIARGVVVHHQHFANGAAGAFDTLSGGVVAFGPDESTGALPPPLPYPPAVYYPATYAPQTHCVRPKIIYLTDEKPATAPVRIIYGTPPSQCW